MKKLKFISAIVLTMVMASCDDYDLPNPPGQTNTDPEAVFEGADLVIDPAVVTEISLRDANNANKDVEVGTIAKLANFPEAYTLSIDMEVLSSDYSKVATMPVSIENNVLYANPDRFNAAIQATNTKQPGTYSTPVRFVAYAVKGNTKLRLGGLDATYCPEELKVTTLDPQKVIEDMYFLVPIVEGTPQWSSAVAMLNTSGSGVSPYDNPEFAVKINVIEEVAQSEAGYEWKVAAASVYDNKNASGLVGCIPAGGEKDALSGKLSGEKAGQIFLQGPVLVTINVEQDSYLVNYALEVLYPLSDKTISNPSAALLLYTDNYINYSGVTTLNSAWSLCGQPDAKGAVVFRENTDMQFVDSEDGLTRNGFLTPKSDGGQLRTPVKKLQLYWADVNLVQLTYSITCLETLSVVGDANGWNEKEAPELTPNKEKTVWTAEDIEVGTMFKINANHTWDIDFGGAAVTDVTGKQQFNIWMKGGNLEPKPGKYKVTVDFRTRPYTVTLE